MLTRRRESASSSGSTAPPLFYQPRACTQVTDRQETQRKEKTKAFQKTRLGALIIQPTCAQARCPDFAKVRVFSIARLKSIRINPVFV